MMKITKLNMYKMEMELVHPFTTSFGTETTREFALIEVEDETGETGWGELVTTGLPLYIEEFTDGSMEMIKKILTPLVVGKTFTHPDEITELFRPFKRNNLAKSAIEGAIWDLYAKRERISLAKALGGNKPAIDVGVSIGIEDNIDDLLTIIGKNVERGYRRIKVKIKPGKDVEVVRAIREQFPDIPLMVDANSAYTLDDVATLKELDPFNLMMIEQPLMAGDLIDHATLQKQIDTPICLDESITSYDDVRQALQLGSCKIINVKIGRVGGLTESRRIHDLCVKHDIPLWCGGMLESGVGRAHNIAITTLGNFTLPGDTAASKRYWKEDVIDPEVTVDQGVLTVPDGPGIGYAVNKEKVLKYAKDEWSFQA